MAGLPVVDPNRIAFWGVSLSASLVIPAAAFDKRAAAVIAVAPLFYYDYITTEWPKLISKTIRDRESQLVHGNPPFYIPALESRGVIPAGSRMNPGSADGALFHNPHASTLQSYYKMGLFQPIPLAMLPGIAPTPVMFLTPENDVISQTHIQKELFATLKGPKKIHIALGKGHVDVLAGDDLGALAKVQIDFLWQAVEGRIPGQVRGSIAS
jgi:pimeloyl-ACP methyl ester carboxylesterase